MASTEPAAEPATASGCIGTKLAPFNPSDPQVVEAALELLALTAADRFYDLGCGDGRLLVAAAKSAGCACEGVEYDARWAAAAQAAAAASGLPDIAVVHGNALDTDLSGMTACFVYLCPAGMKELAPRFIARLAAGARIVTYMFSIPGASPAATRTLRSCPVRLYDASSVPPPPPPPPPLADTAALALEVVGRIDAVAARALEDAVFAADIDAAADAADGAAPAGRAASLSPYVKEATGAAPAAATPPAS